MSQFSFSHSHVTVSHPILLDNLTTLLQPIAQRLFQPDSQPTLPSQLPPPDAQPPLRSPSAHLRQDDHDQRFDLAQYDDYALYTDDHDDADAYDETDDYYADYVQSAVYDEEYLYDDCLDDHSHM